MPTYKLTSAPEFGTKAPALDRLVKADAKHQALAHLLATDEAFREGVQFYVEQVADVIDLTKAKEPVRIVAGNIHLSDVKQQATARLTRSTKSTKAPKGEYTYADVMRRTGLTRKDIANRRQHGVFEKASYGCVTVQSVEDWKARGGKAAEVQRKPRTAPTPTGTDVPWQPMENDTDEFLNIGKAADALGITIDQLRMVKKAGNIGGGFDWINNTQLRAYMAHPEYVAP